MTSTPAPDERTLDSGAGSGGEITDDAFLGGALQLRQPKVGFRAGIDAVLLAATVPRDGSGEVRVLDVGAGVGTVGMCVASRISRARVVLIEKNRELVEMACANRERNGFLDRMEIVASDIALPAAEIDGTGLQREGYDFVLSNPPFHSVGAGTLAKSDIKMRANAMTDGELESWVRFMCRMCAPGGVATVIHKACALDRLLLAMRGRFGALRILPVHPREGLRANRVIVSGVKNSKAELEICPGLILHGDGHGFSERVDAVLRLGAELRMIG